MSRGAALVALAIVALIALNGCGDDEAPDAAADLRLIQVGVLPVANVAPLYLGMKKGFFADERLRVRPIVTSGGTAIVAPVVSGELEMGLPDTVSVLQSAWRRGEPVQIIAQGGLGGTGARESWAKLLALPDGPVRSLADLPGQRVAVNRLGGISEVAVKAAVERAGVEPGKRGVRRGPARPDAAGAEGRPRAGDLGDRAHVTLGEGAGAVALDDLYTGIAPDLTAAAYITSRQFDAEHPEIVQGFTRAVNRSLRYASGHPDEVRAILPTYMTITPEVAQKIVLATSAATDPLRRARDARAGERAVRRRRFDTVADPARADAGRLHAEFLRVPHLRQHQHDEVPISKIDGPAGKVAEKA